jgi:hypothetical protein
MYEPNARLDDMDIVKGKGETRVNLSIPHLMAAAKFSRAVGELESQHAGESLANFWEDIQSYAIGCVLTAVACLEAYANESFDDCSEFFREQEPAALRAIWATYERKQPIEKFKSLLQELSRPRLD